MVAYLPGLAPGVSPAHSMLVACTSWQLHARWPSLVNSSQFYLCPLAFPAVHNHSHRELYCCGLHHPSQLMSLMPHPQGAQVPWSHGAGRRLHGSPLLLCGTRSCHGPCVGRHARALTTPMPFFTSHCCTMLLEVSLRKEAFVSAVTNRQVQKCCTSGWVALRGVFRWC